MSEKLREDFFNSCKLHISDVIVLNVILSIFIAVFYIAIYRYLPQIRSQVNLYKDVIFYMVILAIILIFIKIKIKEVDFIGLKQHGIKRNIKFALALILFIYFAKLCVIIFSKKYYLLGDSNGFDFFISGSIWIVLLHVFIAISIGPIIEEILFRGFFYPPLRRKIGTLAGNVISSFIFMLWHFGIGSITHLVNIFLIGILLAYIYERTTSLIPSIAAHIFINASGLLFNVVSKETVNVNKFAFSTAILFLFLSAVLFISYRKDLKKAGNEIITA